MAVFPIPWGRGQRVDSRGSAMNPALILCGICTPAGAALVAWNIGASVYVGSAVLAVPILYAVWQNFYFTLYDRPRLHSEQHIEAMTVLGRVGDNAAPGLEHTVPKGLLSVNPDVRRDQT
jgi:hypothetical protein